MRPSAAAVTAVALAAGLGGCGSPGRSATASPTTSLPDSIGHQSCAAASHQVELVVQPSASKAYDICVGFRGARISAAAVLARSGVQIATRTYRSGPMLCQVEHIPARYSSCLPVGRRYWAVFTERLGGSWLPATDGLTTTLYPDDELGLRYDSTDGLSVPPAADPAPGVSPPG